MNEPTTITAGDSASWTESLPDYSASDGWALSYVFRSGTQAAVTVNATGSGSEHSVSLSTTVTTPWASGEWYWQSYATKSGQRKTVGSGRIQVKPNFAGSGNFDPRSRVKRTLDAIDACIEGTADRDERMLSVEGFSLELRSVAELLSLRSTYVSLYQQEVNAERVAAGLGNRRKILTRFKQP